MQEHKMVKNRIDWLAVLRGLNILLVVMLHIQLIDMSTGEANQFCHDVTYLFNPIRMPLFIFISGGLLYVSRICKRIDTKTLYIDKFKRIMIPFIFFVNVYYFIKILFSQFVKTPVDYSIQDYFLSFLYFSGHPSAPLWFLATLMIFMLLYPLYCRLCENNLMMIAFFIFTVLFSFVDFDVESRWNVFSILDVNHYLVYFFFGILFFRYKVYDYIDSYLLLIVLLSIYVVSLFMSVKIVSSLIGIVLMCCLCIKVAKRFPKLFSTYREYIFQIYLMSLPFQGFIELILWKRLFYNENLFFLFYLLSVLTGLYVPVLIAKYVERCPVKFVRLCFGLK